MTRPSLYKKILLAMLLLALVPLLTSSLILALNLGKVRERLVIEITATADRQASESLRLRAEQVAETVSNYLEECEADLLLLAALPRDPAIIKPFYDSRRGELWYRAGTPAAPGEMREWVPRYSSLTIVDRTGQETFSIRDGRLVPRSQLRNVAEPLHTEFRSEDYFAQTRRLRKGEVYVSHLTGFHIAKDEQLAGASDPEDAYNGRQYRGIIRFATPLTDGSGAFAGIVVLSLDHRHLMEFTQHIAPGRNLQSVFPSYKSGNYAFMFDDEGWIITHPKFWDIRGVDRDGRLVPPYRSESRPSDVEQGRIPFNLDQAGFIHPNYPVAARLAREGKSGYVDVTNVGGARKLMAFAPIPYRSGAYGRHGIFGAVTIGFQVDQFHEMARTGVTILNSQLQKHLTTSALILAATVLLVLIGSWLVTRGITRPVALLTEGVRDLASGDTDRRVAITSRDELGELAHAFNTMAAELEERKNNLLNTLDELRSSRLEIIDERNFKESVLESISSAILTFSPAGALTSINGNGSLLFAGSVHGVHLTTIFHDWPELAEKAADVLADGSGFGRQPFTRDHAGYRRFYEIGFFPIGPRAEQGITVTIRDETEKEQLREEMTRLDRLASLGKLAAGIAHEVRNPLTGISLLLDDLHDRSGLDADGRTMVGKALTEIERVEKLISSLLNYSSPPRTRMRPGDLGRVIQDTVLLLRRECERRHVELAVDFGTIPSFAFDGEKIKQALINLVKNAIDVMPDGGTIRISTAMEQDRVAITVADSGPGIVEEDLPLIFEPFFSRKGAGTGLGLSITQRIVEEHHGRITVESLPGAGTTFTIQLPLTC
jgi:signal transduction histidine kinase